MPEFDSTVEYREVSGFPDYRVGSDSSVWSFGRRGNRKPCGVWHQLVACPDGVGYPLVCLHCGKIRRPVRVHTLVLEAFVGPCPDGMECRHLDGNPGNSRLDNVCWGTHLENAQDKHRHGTQVRGSRHGRVKLTEDVVRAIRASADRTPGWCERLARQHAISPSHVRAIIRRVFWGHLL